jgi:hypothetical protein
MYMLYNIDCKFNVDDEVGSTRKEATGANIKILAQNLTDGSVGGHKKPE